MVSLVQEVKYDKATVSMELPQEQLPSADKTKKPRENKTAKKETTTLPVKGLGTCPACKEGHIVKGSSAFGCIRYKDGCRFLIPIEQQGKQLTEKQVTALLTKGKTPVIKGFKSEDGKLFDATISLDNQHQVKLEQAQSTAAPDPFAVCPRCKQGQLLKGKTAYGCSRFREGCQFKVPFEIGAKTLSQKQIATLLTKGKTEKIKGFVSQQTGNKFDASLIINEQWQVVYQF